MTIAATTNRTSQDGNGVTTAFPFNYPFHAQADLVVISTVILTGVQTIKALTTHYTISGSTDAEGHYTNGGTVNFITAPASTERITIYRDPAITQGVDLTENDPLPVNSSVESPLDRLTMIVQRLSDRINRSLRQPEGDAADIDLLPAKVTRASMFLAFDTDGDPVASAGTTETPVSTFMATVLDDITAAAARTTLGAQQVTEGLPEDTNPDPSADFIPTYDTSGSSASKAKPERLMKVGSRVMGCDCKNNAGTPNTQFDLDADEIVLRDANGGAVVRVNPGAALTNNVSTAGSIANGRDQAGAFSISSWVHFYWIWNGVTLATLSSATAPPTGPTLPTGYTHWAYAGAVYFNSSSQLLPVRIKGSRVWYEVGSFALSTGSATIETAVSLAAMVPPNALAVRGYIRRQITSDGAGTVAYTLTLRVITTKDYQLFATNAAGLAVTTALLEYGHPFSIPQVAQNLYYLFTVTNGTTPAADIVVLGYTIPNGGE